MEAFDVNADKSASLPLEGKVSAKLTDEVFI
jgi:hypothetical protein